MGQGDDGIERFEIWKIDIYLIFCFLFVDVCGFLSRRRLIYLFNYLFKGEGERGEIGIETGEF